MHFPVTWQSALGQAFTTSDRDSLLEAKPVRTEAQHQLQHLHPVQLVALRIPLPIAAAARAILLLALVVRPTGALTAVVGGSKARLDNDPARAVRRAIINQIRAQLRAINARSENTRCIPDNPPATVSVVPDFYR